MKNKLLAILFIFFTITCINFEFVSASSVEQNIQIADNKKKSDKNTDAKKNDGKSTTSNEKNLLNSILNSGGSFFNQGKSSGSASDSFGQKIKSQIFGDSGLGLQGIIQLVGNLIFLIVTVVLGIKYVFSGIEGKSIVKETLPTFMIGIVFFYLADNLVRFFSGVGNDIQNKTDANLLVGSIWQTVSAVAQILCIAGIILVGLKYMFSDSVKKADVKNQSVMIVLGLMLALSAIPILNFIIDTGAQLFP